MFISCKHLDATLPLTSISCSKMMNCCLGKMTSLTTRVTIALKPASLQQTTEGGLVLCDVSPLLLLLEVPVVPVPVVQLELLRGVFMFLPGKCKRLENRSMVYTNTRARVSLQRSTDDKCYGTMYQVATSRRFQIRPRTNSFRSTRSTTRYKAIPVT